MTQLHMATHGTRALPGPLPARPRPCQAARLPPAACLRCAGAGASGTQQRLVGREGRRRRLCATQMPQQQEAATEESAVAGRAEAGGNEPEQSFGVRVALGLLSFYKNGISPLLPPSCRYLPTCSAYAMDAYKEYGVGKGTVLTAWRLLRCSPFGSSGYDPVRWPPPGLEWMFPQ